MSTQHDGDGLSRRGFLRTGALAAGTAAASGTATAQESEDGEGTATAEPTPTGREVPDFDGYLEDVSNYDEELTDLRGQDEVTVEVGAAGNNGNFAFGPAAVQIEPGTTVVWEWTGEGGQHNVLHEDGDAFGSELKGEAGATFEHEFGEAGVYRYYCDPHKALGMKGAIVVGDDYPTRIIEIEPADGGDEGEGEMDTPGETAGDPMAAETLLAMLGLGFLSPVIFAILLRWRRPNNPVE
ncbi:MAG: halocyanin domain-containing protein [Haloarculaceae archaeon]